MRFSEFTTGTDTLCADQGMTLEAIGLAPVVNIREAGQASRPVINVAVAVMRYLDNAAEGQDAARYQVAACGIENNGFVYSPYYETIVTSGARVKPFDPSRVKEGGDKDLAARLMTMHVPKEQILGGLSLCYVKGEPGTLRVDGQQTTPAALALVFEQQGTTG